jgi:O-antigen biosynthesis protein
MTTKRVLVCSPVMPEYDRESGSRRIFDLIEFLRDAGWAVSFAATATGGGAERYAKMLQQRGVATFLGLDRMESVIGAGRFDLAILAFWEFAESLMPTIRAHSPATRVIVDTIDLHFVRHARGIFLEPSRALDPEYAYQMAREVNVYAAADGVLAVSQKEADLINDLIGDPASAHVVPDGEDLPPSELPFAEREGILFIGNFRHPPNVEAARYLCTEILPKLDPATMAEHPVYIVGNALNETVRGYGDGLAHVRMVGWVPSVLPYLQRARVSIVPLLHGAGTKRKLIQALMAGTPTVSTSMGIEGLNLQDGEHVMVADDPATFADSIARLLEDTELWERLARQGCNHVTTAHSREAARVRLIQTVSTILAKDVKSGERAGRDPKLHQLGVDQYNRELEERSEVLVQELKARNEELRARSDSLEHELHSIRNSRTWRLFGPYRRLRTKLASSHESG